jgi:hypothetical protein
LEFLAVNSVELNPKPLSKVVEPKTPGDYKRTMIRMLLYAYRGAHLEEQFRFSSPVAAIEQLDTVRYVVKSARDPSFDQETDPEAEKVSPDVSQSLHHKPRKRKTLRSGGIFSFERLPQEIRRDIFKMVTCHLRFFNEKIQADLAASSSANLPPQKGKRRNGSVTSNYTGLAGGGKVLASVDIETLNMV